jgi:hypothetical protein
MKKVALCFPVKNCEEYLDDIFKNINKLKNYIDNVIFYCIFVYDNCTDNSEKILFDYKKKNELTTIIKKIENKSQHRTVRIANARNELLNIVYSLDNISLHIMIDADDRSTPPWNISALKYYIIDRYKDTDWDAMTFDRSIYYDFWALLFDNFKQHCYGFSIIEENDEKKKKEILYKARVIMKIKLIQKLIKEKKDSVDVISAFNGFGIYKTNRFKNIYYDGLYENVKPFFTDIDRCKTLSIFHRHGLKELILNDDCICCCEHVFFHILSIHKNRCKIKISKFKIL